ncbi:MAG: prepilin peptidase, partial [Anaerococcus hydrogenalis]|nr:prepilin peptidase [Anaerococcus hydrogenalis]
IGDGDYFFYISLFLFLENEKIIYLLLGSVWIGAIPAIYLAIKNNSTKIIMPFCIYIYLAYIVALL